MINTNLIPEKLNDYRAYVGGNRMIGTTGEVSLPEIKMLTTTISGAGLGGEIESPTIGQFEKMDMELPFNTLYSSCADMLSPLKAVDITLRGAQQVMDTSGGYVFKQLRVVIRGRSKAFKPGKLKVGDAMDASVTLEVTYMLIEVDGSALVEIDKLNSVYKVNGVDMLADIKSML